MMVKKLLLIDNEDQTETIKTINDLAKKKNFAIECHPFYIGLPAGGDVVGEDGKIIIKKVKEKYEQEFGSTRFHLIAFDFNLNDNDVDGVEIIRQFNSMPKTMKVKKILFSFELTEIVQGYLDEYKEKENYDKAWNSFKTLINLEILDFAKREDIEKKVVDYIQKIGDKEDDFIVDELLGNKDLLFNPVIEIYDGLNFEQIAEKILANDSLSMPFKRKLIQLAVSYFSMLENE